MLTNTNRYAMPTFLIMCFLCTIAMGQSEPTQAVSVPATLAGWADAAKQITATVVLALGCYIFWKDNKELRAKLLSVMENAIKENTASNYAVVEQIKRLADTVHDKVLK